MVEKTKTIKLMVDDDFERNFFKIKYNPQTSFDFEFGSRILAPLFALYNPRVNNGEPRFLAAVNDNGLFTVPDYEIKEENFVKFTLDMLDSAFCAECEYMGCYHETSVQKKYNKLCAKRRKKLKFPCVCCPSSHFDDAYINGIFVDVGCKEYVDDLWVLKTQEGIEIPMSGEQKETALKMFSKEYRKGDI